MVLVVDPRGAGISGDMILASLVDMGADGAAISDGITDCARYLEGSSIVSMRFSTMRRNATRCTRLELEALDPTGRPAAEIVRAIDDSVSHLGISEKAAAFARRSIKALVSAESRIHDIPHDKVRLHEAASIDTMVDIVGTAMGLDHIGGLDDRIITMPVNVGCGSVTFSHGTSPNPVPAVLEILKEAGIAMTGSDISTETATPTGACMLAGLGAVSQTFYPEIIVERTGYGAGSRDHSGVANVLVLAQGRTCGSVQTIYVLETNLDDATGETIGGAISEIMRAGALDVVAYPGTGKKGRTSHLLSALCTPEMADSLAHVIIRQTGTLGVRITPTDRFVLPRETRRITAEINGVCHTFRYKIHTHTGETDFKIEYDDIASAAASSGMRVTHLERLVRRQIEDNH